MRRLPKLVHMLRVDDSRAMRIDHVDGLAVSVIVDLVRLWLRHARSSQTGPVSRRTAVDWTKPCGSVGRLAFACVAGGHQRAKCQI
jgi:hypothetical protein